MIINNHSYFTQLTIVKSSITQHLKDKIVK